MGQKKDSGGECPLCQGTGNVVLTDGTSTECLLCSPASPIAKKENLKKWTKSPFPLTSKEAQLLKEGGSLPSARLSYVQKQTLEQSIQSMKEAVLNIEAIVGPTEILTPSIQEILRLYFSALSDLAASMQSILSGLPKNIDLCFGDNSGPLDGEDGDTFTFRLEDPFGPDS
jgi:hypothetical protein